MNKRTTPQRVVERANIVLCSAEGRSGSAINHYIDRRNDNPTPFVWTASAQSIIAKVSKAKETLATQQ